MLLVLALAGGARVHLLVVERDAVLTQHILICQRWVELRRVVFRSRPCLAESKLRPRVRSLSTNGRGNLPEVRVPFGYLSCLRIAVDGLQVLHDGLGRLFVERRRFDHN